MKDKNLALHLMAFAAAMLLDEETTPKVQPKSACRCQRQTVMPKPTKPMFDFSREPDGVQINVDRPRIEKFGSRHKWAEAMANYRTLIDQAKKCDWESRVPENIPAHVHANRRDWYEDNEPLNFCPEPTFPSSRRVNKTIYDASLVGPSSGWVDSWMDETIDDTFGW